MKDLTSLPRNRSQPQKESVPANAAWISVKHRTLADPRPCGFVIVPSAHDRDGVDSFCSQKQSLPSESQEISAIFRQLLPSEDESRYLHHGRGALLVNHHLQSPSHGGARVRSVQIAMHCVTVPSWSSSQTAPASLSRVPPTRTPQSSSRFVRAHGRAPQHASAVESSATNIQAVSRHRPWSSSQTARSCFRSARA